VELIESDSDADSSRELAFQCQAYRLAALEWGRGRPVLALHGWLDNAGSFARLAPALTGCRVIALEAAGHGASGDRSADSGYNIWQELGDVLDVVAGLGWTTFDLLGHSRGGAVATLFAGTFPERVENLMLLEGGLPIVGEAADAPENLAKALIGARERRGRSGRIFASRDAAIAERVNGFTPVTTEAAEILARRSLREVAGGWQWHADSRLKVTSELRLTRDLLAPFLDRITARTICILAEESPFADLAVYRDMLTRIAGIEVHRLPGRHHFHLEGQASEIAALLNRFLGSH
jgi:pimeloyl-ACP methyl ester carboxylesterase